MRRISQAVTSLYSLVLLLFPQSGYAAAVNELDAASLSKVRDNLSISVTVASKTSSLLKIRLDVKNDGNVPVVIDTTNAELSGTNSLALQQSSSKLFQRRVPRLINGILAASSVGIIPTLAEISEQKGTVLDRYGKDQERRKIEEEMFGKSLIYPGESATGLISFSAPTSRLPRMKSITLQMASYYEPGKSVKISAPIAPAHDLQQLERIVPEHINGSSNPQ